MMLVLLDSTVQYSMLNGEDLSLRSCRTLSSTSVQRRSSYSAHSRAAAAAGR